MELSPQDDQLLAAHLDSCQSCSRFQHQIDQVVQAAAELPIPEEAAPTNLESLARMIMQQLPQPKSNILSVFGGLFGGGGGAKAKEPKPQKQAPQPMDDKAGGGSRFPHVRRKKATEEVEKPGAKGKKTRESTEQEVTAARLRGLSKKSQSIEEQSQSGVRSLGEKFGMVAPHEQSAEEAPMTLAQSIRRRVTEQVTGDKIQHAQSEAAAFHDGAGEEGWAGGGPSPPRDEEPAAPPWGQSTSGSGHPVSGMQQPGGIGQQEAAQPGAWNQPQQGGGGGWGDQQQQGGDGGWGDQQQQGGGGGWGDQQQQGGGGGQPQPPGTWGQAQPQVGHGGQPPQPDTWGQPPAQAQQQGGGWGQQPAQARTDDWGQSDGSSSGNVWGQGGGGGQAPQNEWGGSPQPGGWGGGGESSSNAPSSGGGWDSSPSPPAPGGNAWGGAQAANEWSQSQPTPTGGAWDEPKPPAGNKHPTWSDEAEQIQTGMWEAFAPSESLGAKTPAPGPQPPQPSGPQPPQPADRWDVPINERMQPQPQAPAPAASPTGDRWDVPIQERMQPQAQPSPAPAAPAADRWDIPIQDRMKGGGGPEPQQAAPAPSSSSGGLPVDSIMNRLSNILSDSGEVAPAPQADLQGTAPAADRWDMPIQERMQQQAQPPAPPAAPTADRWDVPIQERMQQQAQAQAPAAAPAADRFDVPIQERLQQQAQSAAAPAADRFDVPIQERIGQQGAQPPAQAQQSSGIFKNLDDSAMDKLFSENLGVAGAAPAQPPPSAPGTPTISPVAPRQPQAAAPPQPAAPPPSPPPTLPPQPAAAQEQPRGLLSLDDNAMDQLFGDNLGVNEPSRPVQPAASGAWQNPATPPQSAPPPAPPPPPVPPAPDTGGWSQPTPIPSVPAASAAPAPPAPPAPPQPAQQQGGGLFSLNDEAMDRLFGDNLGVQAAPLPNVNVNDAVQSIRTAAGAPPQPAQAAPMPQAGPAPKVEGVGRLSKTDSSPETGSGKIASIGKFLLDQQDMNKLGKIASSDLSDTQMRILTLEAAQELQGLLHTIGQQASVVGSVIVGHDGILIANTMPKNIDPESIGVWALGIYLNTDGVLKRLGHDHIHQVVARTPLGYLIIADFGGGILVTVTEGSQTELLMPLMRSITQLVAQ